MNKKYVTPTSTTVDITTRAILACSAGEDKIDVCLSDNEMGGSQALSNKKSGIWQYMEE